MSPRASSGAEAPVPPAALAAMRAPFEALNGAAQNGQPQNGEGRAVWIEPPVLQPLGLLLDLAGEAMRARLFLVSGGVEEMALRPDFTIAVTRAHIASGRAAGRYLYQGQAFRTAPVDSGRPVEFLQLGVEQFGASDDPAGDDARIAALAWRAATAGGRRDLGVLMGDASLLRTFVRALGLPKAAVVRLQRAAANPRALALELERAEAGADPGPADSSGRLAALLGDLPESEAAGVLHELWRLAGIQPVGGRSPQEIAHRLASRAEGAARPRLSPAEAGLLRRFLAISAPPRVALEQAEALAAEAQGDLTLLSDAWAQRLKLMQAEGLEEGALTLQTAFARPFGYYDGVLFEVRSASLAWDEPVAAGGRYDALPERLGGAPGAVGCVVRPGRAFAPEAGS